jgi:hypothetical protein
MTLGEMGATAVMAGLPGLLVAAWTHLRVARLELKWNGALSVLMSRGARAANETGRAEQRQEDAQALASRDNLRLSTASRRPEPPAAP